MTCGNGDDRDARIDGILDMIKEMALGNFEFHGGITHRHDEIDAITTGISMLAEELRARELEKADMEEALLESEKKYRLLVESLREGLGIVDSEENIVYANPAFCDIIGYDEDEITERNLLEIVHPDDVPGMLKETEKRKENKSSKYGLRIRRKDGAVRNIEVYATPWRDPDNDLRGTIGLVLDVTEAKRMEDSRRDSELRYRTIFENANDLIAYIGKDGKIIDVNDRIMDYIGYERDEVIGKNIFERGIISGKTLPRLMEMFFSALRTGRPLRYLETEVLHRDGSSTPIEVSTNLIRKNGRAEGYLSIFRNVKERLEAGKALRESEEKYRAVVTRSDDCIFLVDIHTRRIVEANPALRKLLGYSAGEVQGLVLYDFVAHQRKDVDEKIERIISSGTSFLGERRYRTKTGEVIDVEVDAGIISYGGRDVISVVSRDITERKRAEKALRESEERFRMVVNNAFDAIYIRRNKYYEYVNPRFCELTGYACDELTDPEFDVNVMIGEETRRFLEERYEARKRGEEIPREYEIEVMNKEGKTVYLDNLVVPLEDGKGVGSIGFMRDISSRKQADMALHESEERYRTLFETMVQGVVYQDVSGEIISANPAAERILGLSLDQMQGRTSMDPRWRTIQADGTDFPGEAHPSMVALRTGKEIENVTMGVFNPSQEEYRWINVNAVPLFRPGEGEPYQVYTTFEDITDRKKAVEELWKREHELTERVKELNTLYRISRLIEQPDLSLELFLDEVVTLIPSGWQYPDITVARLRIEEGEFSTPGFKGTPWVQNAPVYVFGNPVGRVEVAYLKEMPEMDEGPFSKEERDLINALAERLGKYIEERRTAEKLLEYRDHLENMVERRTRELIQAEKLAYIGQLVAGIAHEINSPLAVISLYAGMLGTDAMDERTRGYVEIIASQVNSASKIVSNLLDFTKISHMERSSMDLNQLIHRIIRVVGHQLELSKICIEHDLGSDLPAISGDRDRIKQVIMNIVMNAYHAIGSEGTITITTRSLPEGSVELEVADTGSGISPEDMGRIFEPFYTSQSVKGTGLGLSISKEIVESHGGHITLVSEKGVGSTFHIRLPVHGGKSDPGK